MYTFILNIHNIIRPFMLALVITDGTIAVFVKTVLTKHLTLFAHIAI